jgi:hypothetical protein
MEPHVAVVPRDLEGLIPGFMKNRKADVAALAAALKSQQAARLKLLGERIYSIGNPYGFRYLTLLGKRIATAAEAGNLDEIAGLVAAYADYLERVHIEYE